MGILLVVVVICGLLFFAVRSLLSYDAEFRKGQDAGDVSIIGLTEFDSPSDSIHVHSPHHTAPDCGSHRDTGCDFGGHGGFGGGHH